jgi:glucuronate isomerase
MQSFINDDFLLQSDTAKELYHQHAEHQPIIDYHCHLNPEYIANDHQFDNLGQIWLEGDHYKWRAMRSNGIDEKYCTGKDTSDWEKFEKWAENRSLYHAQSTLSLDAFGVETGFRGGQTFESGYS